MNGKHRRIWTIKSGLLPREDKSVQVMPIRTTFICVWLSEVISYAKITLQCGRTRHFHGSVSRHGKFSAAIAITLSIIRPEDESKKKMPVKKRTKTAGP